VIAITKSIGKAFAETGVLVNCVAPAVIQTRMLDDISEEHVRYMVERIPMKRVGQHEEVGALMVLLASEACSFSMARCPTYPAAAPPTERTQALARTRARTA
jgi:3-oxoacyl-[acyl-carrier protein] reductase